MLKKLEFSNYKSFTTQQSIVLKPITILIGPNSAGKSSIMKLLGFLEQSTNQNKDKCFVFNGANSDMNSFLEMTSNNNGMPIEISLTTDLPYGDAELTSEIEYTSPEYYNKTKIQLNIFSDKYVEGKLSKVKNDEDTKLFYYSGLSDSHRHNRHFTVFPPRKEILNQLESEAQVQINWFKESGAKLHSYKDIANMIQDWASYAYAYEAGYKGFFPTTWIGNATPKFIDRPNRYQEVHKYQDIPDHWQKLILDIDTENPEDMENLEFHLNTYLLIMIHKIKKDDKKKTSEKSYAYSDAIQDSFLLTTISNSIETALKKLIFVPPIRKKPQRVYSLDDLKRYTFSDVCLSKNFQSLVTMYLNWIIEDVEFQIEEISTSHDLYAIKIINRNSKHESYLNDVGYGFSQVLPIIFSKIKITKTVLLEQPELHLHPTAQSKIAELLTMDYAEKRNHNLVKILADSTPDGESQGVPDLKSAEKLPISIFSNQYIIETHSEHILRGIQLQIAKGFIDNNNVAIYYVSKDSNGNSNVEPFKIKDNGFFEKTLPQGFYDSATLLQEALWEVGHT